MTILPARFKKFLLRQLGDSSPSLLRSFFSLSTSAGISVDEKRALNFSAVWACVRAISETIASLPLHLYRRDPKTNDKTRAPLHPLYPLLHSSPNRFMTAMTFRESLMEHLLLWGNGYIYPIKGGALGISELRLIQPDVVSPMEVNGEIIYRISTTKGTVDLRSDEICHVPALSHDGIIGYSPIRLMREAVAMGLAMEEFGARFFGSGTHPSVVVEHPGKLGPSAHKNLKDSLTDAHSGLGKSHQLMVLEEGMKLQSISVPPEEAQFLQSRRFQLNEIARAFRIPPHIIGDLERASLNNIEQQSIEFVVHCIRPWLVRLEQAFNLNLLTEQERRTGYYFEHLVDGLLRGDLQSRYNAYAVGKLNGWLSANDIRDFENMNHIKDGDEYTRPANTVPAGSPGPDPDPTPPVEPEPSPEPEPESQKKTKKAKVKK